MDLQVQFCDSPRKTAIYNENFPVIFNKLSSIAHPPRHSSEPKIPDQKLKRTIKNLTLKKSTKVKPKTRKSQFLERKRRWNQNL